jgi:hypothetical protein
MLRTYYKNIIKLLLITIKREEFWNYRLFKKTTVKGVTPICFRYINKHKYAIVVQGPMISDSDFTLNSLYLYRKNFPDAIIILSTWPIQDDIINHCQNNNIIVIQNIMPLNPGISNINLQILTTRAGIEKAQELGAIYVLKTRTDQRLYHPSLLDYLYNLVISFPVTNKYKNQTSRIVGISLNSYKWRLYGLSDMFLYGHISDMIKYWCIPLDERTDALEERKNAGQTWLEFSLWRVCEVYLCSHFLTSLGRKLSFTLKDSLYAYKDHFIIVDHYSIGLYWHKYSLISDRYLYRDMPYPELGFNDWMMLYNNIDDLFIDESILNLTI